MLLLVLCALQALAAEQAAIAWLRLPGWRAGVLLLLLLLLLLLC